MDDFLNEVLKPFTDEQLKEHREMIDRNWNKLINGEYELVDEDCSTGKH